jgi:hypothetical protein
MRIRQVNLAEGKKLEKEAIFHHPGGAYLRGARSPDG